jgi:hypothetical protein
MLGSLPLFNQTFGLVYNEVGSAFEALPMSGIVGLGLPGIAIDGTTPPFDNVIASKKLTHNIIAIRLGKHANDIGELRLGSIDTAWLADNLVFTPAISDIYWEVEIQDLLINGATSGACSYIREKQARCGAAIDTGTSVIGGPTHII